MPGPQQTAALATKAAGGEYRRGDYGNAKNTTNYTFSTKLDLTGLENAVQLHWGPEENEEFSLEAPLRLLLLISMQYT